jgi:hypothetical protein
MTASCLSTPLVVAHGLRRPLVRPRLRARGLALPAVIALVLGAALLVPEQPRAQAEICERHNGAAACRIW